MGETITLVVTPAKGYKMQSLTATHATGVGAGQGTITPALGNDGNYTFAMPASAVSVNATFVKDESTAITGIEADGRQGVRYVNPMGQVSDRPFPGINIVIDGDKTYKVVK